jgi:hypothetical protein
MSYLSEEYFSCPGEPHLNSHTNISVSGSLSGNPLKKRKALEKRTKYRFEREISPKI